MSKLNKYSIFLILINYFFCHECIILNPNQYGDCEFSLGYSWNGSDCLNLIQGCSYQNSVTGFDDSNSFYVTYEECIANCFQHSGVLGDLNEDLEIDILDIVLIINLIINDWSSPDHQFWAGDVNQDISLDILDIVVLLNRIIASSQDTRSSLEIISQEIFNSACVSCHYTGSFYAEQSGLIMEQDLLYDEIINKIPKNHAAANDGLYLISNEGGMVAKQNSYLWKKISVWEQQHFYSEHPNYGDLMPLGGPFLTNGQLAFIEKWIIEGAPEISSVATPALLLDDNHYEPPTFSALQPPENGFQFQLGPFDVPPGTEKEFFYYEPNLSSEDIYINRFQVTMRPGSHHFIFYTFNNDIPNFLIPQSNDFRDLYDISGNPINETQITMGYHKFVAGTQYPFMDYQFPSGIALRVPHDYGFDLNGHYFNYTNQPIVGEIYANIHTVNFNEVEQIAEILQLSNNNIYLPPNEVTTIEKIYSFNQIKERHDLDDEVENIYIFQLMSHAHQLMKRFDVEYYDSASGEHNLIYTATDYLHPPILSLNNHLNVKQNDYIKIKAIYDNTTNNPVEFGLLSVDEMMILFGYFYFD